MVYHRILTQDHFFPVLPKDPVSLKWHCVLYSNKTRCVLDINSIGCYRVGTSANYEDNPPTIFMTETENESRLEGIRGEHTSYSGGLRSTDGSCQDTGRRDPSQERFK